MHIRAIDEWLFSHCFEPTAWAWQYRTGKNGVWIARMLNFGLAPFAFLTALWFLRDMEGGGGVALLCGVAMLWSAYYANKEFVELERRLEARHDGLNPYRGKYVSRFVYTLIFATLMAVHWILLGENGSAFIVALVMIFLYALLIVYFRSCNAMPGGYEERFLLPHEV